ncbi:MAG: hypothetical protein AAF940_14620 [Pseudomonadota bacterium]
MKRSDLSQARGAGKKQSQPRILQLDWYIGPTPVKTARMSVKELSHLIKIVAQQLTNMPIDQRDGGKCKLSISIISTEQTDFIWAIRHTNKIAEFKKYLLRRGVNMEQVYLILHSSGSSRVIPLFETEAIGSIPHPARN